MQTEAAHIAKVGLYSIAKYILYTGSKEISDSDI
jgi:hypothetical protein